MFVICSCFESGVVLVSSEMCVVFVLLLESCRDVCSLCVTVGVLQRCV